MVGDTIADFVNDLDISNVPPEVVEKTKLLILDTLCVALRGRESEEVEMVRKVMLTMGGKPDSLVIKTGERLPAPHAALVNATMAHAIELDDTDRYTYYHPGAPVITTALAVAEQTGCSGKQFLEAVIAGYEVSIRIADAVNPSHRDRGFHTTGTIGTFGSGIAASKIMNLDKDKIKNTLGLSGTQAAGLFEFLSDGSMTKRIHPSKSVWNGIFAARLAEGGITAPHTILEGEHGFLQATTDYSREEMLTDRFSDDYRLMRVGLKRHAACRYCHTPVDAALDLRRVPEVNISAIKKVTVLTGGHCYRQTGKASAATLMAAQLSTPYAVALALVRGTAGIDAYTEGLEDKEVVDLMDKVEVKEDKSIENYSRKVLVQVELTNGKIAEKEVALPKGEPENPLSAEEIKAKNKSLVRKILDEQHFEKLSTYINHLEEQNQLNDLYEMLK